MSQRYFAGVSAWRIFAGPAKRRTPKKSDESDVLAKSDTVAKSGVFFFKPQGATGPGTKLDKKGDSFALEAGKTYEFNYDTTAGTMAATLKFRDPGGKYTEVNFKFLEVAGRRSDVRVGLTSDDWANSSLDFHLSGCFVQGKTFIAMD